jgi:phage gp46-like protein
LWDSVWVQRGDASGGYADWIMAGPGDQVDSRGGLRAEQALHTATILCLFTDRRRPDGNAGDGQDPRGWWGNAIVIDGEPGLELGSLLWTLERGIINEAVRALAQTYASEALATLKHQGAVARTAVAASIDEGAGHLALRVDHYSADGKTVYSQRFSTLWKQVPRAAPMNFS